MMGVTLMKTSLMVTKKTFRSDFDRAGDSRSRTIKQERSSFFIIDAFVGPQNGQPTDN